MRKPFRRRLTIYGQVVITITIMSIVLFLAFGIIFRSVNESYLDKEVRRSGSNISSIVEGALYHSMLTNDRGALVNTLDVINSLPGIEDVNMYDGNDEVVYSAFSDDPVGHNNPNCKECHPDLNLMLPRMEKSFTIINLRSDCEMSMQNQDYRLLMIKAPILNQPSCSTASCHAHSGTEQVLGSFVIRIPLRDFDHAIQLSSRNFFVLAACTTLLLAAFLMFFTRKNINRPLNAIISASDAVSKGDISSRLELESSRLIDIQLVSKAFNKMLDNLQKANKELQEWSSQLEDKVEKKSKEVLEMQKELMHVERIASLGKLSSSVAHEINNPLSGVLTYTKLVQKQLQNVKLNVEVKGPMLKYLKVIEDETKRCGDIVKGLLDFSRKDQSDFKKLHLNKVLEEAYGLMEHQMKISGIIFRKEFSAKTDIVNCADNHIKQASIAILLNAYEAVGEHGEIEFRTFNPDEEHIAILVKDNGTGISPEDLPHVFEPFFSAKEKVSGIGLGLAIVHGIIKNHNGNVEISSQPGKGTVVEIILPVARE